MTISTNIAALVSARRRLAEFLDLEAPNEEKEIAARLMNQLPLPRASIAVAIDRSTDYVSIAITRVELRMRRDQAFRARVEKLLEGLKAAG